MLTKDELHKRIAEGLHILDGATGSNLRKAGMPRDVCTEQWILENPEPLVALQRQFAQAAPGTAAMHHCSLFSRRSR